jgi:hypothetical protein
MVKKKASAKSGRRRRASCPVALFGFEFFKPGDAADEGADGLDHCLDHCRVFPNRRPFGNLLRGLKREIALMANIEFPGLGTPGDNLPAGLGRRWFWVLIRG